MRFFTIAVVLALLECHSSAPPQNQPAMTKTTASASEITITGLATNEGVECPAVRGDDGKLYTIVGKDREKLKPGLRVKITGVVAEMSTCMQGITINAARIEVISAPS